MESPVATKTNPVATDIPEVFVSSRIKELTAQLKAYQNKLSVGIGRKETNIYHIERLQKELTEIRGMLA